MGTLFLLFAHTSPLYLLHYRAFGAKIRYHMRDQSELRNIQLTITLLK